MGSTTKRPTQSTSRAEHGCGSHPVRWRGNAGPVDKSLLSSARSKDCSYLLGKEMHAFISTAFDMYKAHISYGIWDTWKTKWRITNTPWNPNKMNHVEASVYVLSFFRKERLIYSLNLCFGVIPGCHGSLWRPGEVRSLRTEATGDYCKLPREQNLTPL